MSDLTIMFITANEVPEGWARFHQRHLVGAAGKHKIIAACRRPMDGPWETVIEDGRKDYGNIYKLMLRVAERANTPYVAMAEDDVLYSADHFNYFRPKPDEFAYNRSRWSLFTWEAMYSVRQRISNCSLIAPRELLIEALRERFAKYPNDDYPLKYMGECGRNSLEAGLGVTLRKKVDFFSEVPVIQLSHPNGTEERQRIGRKKHGQIKAYDIPYWGRAEDIIKEYN